MILAAGEGRRMLPLTETCPKVLLEAGGRSLLAHQIEKLAAAGVSELVINHAYLGEQIEAAIGDGSQFGVSVRWSREGRPLETAGGIIRALPLLGSDSFILVNGDIWTDYSFSALEALSETNWLAHLVLVPNPGHHRGGDFCIGEDGTLFLQDGSSPGYTYSGISVFQPEFFHGTEAGKLPLRPLLDKAIAAGKVRGELFRGRWMDIGTPERLEELHQLLERSGR